MPISSLKRIKFGCHDTRRNLPVASSAKRGESNFLAKFERVFFHEELKSVKKTERAATGREFSVDGFGRADLLFMAWKPSADQEDFSAVSLKNQIKLTAIEAKLKDWRKGLMQAARYRFFADRSVLVLPPATLRVAISYLETFKDLNVGLWEFDAPENRLTKHFTPRSTPPLNMLARTKAINAIKTHLDFS